ncbi:MAG TPA: glucan biosynthesis protein G [Burkholderiales bacterium]
MQHTPPAPPVRSPSVKRPVQSRIQAIFLLLAAAAVAPAAYGFGFDDVAKAAEQLAAQPWKKPGAGLPKELESLNYDQYRDIRYKPDNALWRGARLPFELTFFHEGFRYDQPVKISEVGEQGPVEVKFDPAQFDYGSNKLDTGKFGGLGYAGFRVHFPLNNGKVKDEARVKDEVLSFVGASYFRAVGKDQGYGLSARGLALDTGLPSGEEFPRFTEFWIERPAAAAKELVIYGLLDSRRVAGAYRFVVKPGIDTAIEVKARLYLREAVGKFGVAPLTSMFFYGENQRSGGDDYRPEVHDSDGLLVHAANGEWIWRPLQNPKRLLVTSFATANPIGFGLMQRDRDFSSYEDLEARYERRPSAWVEPKGSWGPGRVELVQIPSPDESNDNIVAYWVPDAVPAPKQPWDVEYRLLWQKDTETRPPHAWVTQSRRGHGYVRGPENSVGMIVDFDGPLLRKLPADAQVEGVIANDANVEILRRHTHRNEVTGGWRTVLEMRRLDNSKPAELRAYLRQDNNPVSETWSYILPVD